MLLRFRRSLQAFIRTSTTVCETFGQSQPYWTRQLSWCIADVRNLMDNIADEWDESLTLN